MSTYTFLPYLRRGIVNQADKMAATGRVHIPLQLQVAGEGGNEVPAIVQREIALYGPGDITGIDARSVVRTIPRMGVRDFEANFLTAIEFYDEDFPWRFSPVLPDGGRLIPWIWLTVLEENEYQRLEVVKGRLPSIEILSETMKNAFPDPETLSSWAHVHLNFKLEGPDVKSDIVKKLSENPNLGCSRLICPRRLRPDARYRAFLLPTFEKGRLAGLGKKEEEMVSVPNMQMSWSANPTASVIFPVYFEWEFSTASAGDFEDLALKLAPITLDEQNQMAASAKRFDVREAGWGIRGAKGSLLLESALKLPVPSSLTAAEKDDKKILRQKIAPLLNLGVEPPKPDPNQQSPFFFNKTGNNTTPAKLDDDPIVTPPMYGSFYRPGERLSDTEQPDWLPQLNLDPTYRVAAAQGTGVIQQNQEELMENAWQQWAYQQEVQRSQYRWMLSMELSKSVFERRIIPILKSGEEEDRYKAAIFLSPVLPTASKTAGGSTSFNTLEKTNLSFSSTFSRSFIKVTRAGGPLMRRASTTGNSSMFFVRAFSLQAQVPTEKPMFSTFLAMSEFLKDFGGATDLAKSLGLTHTDPLQKAGKKWYDSLNLTFIADPVRMDKHNAIGTLMAELHPKITVAQRQKATLGIKLPDPQSPEHPVFLQSTYRELADRNRDFILPGLEKIPVNRAVLLQTNQAFIDAYMVGLNHEMGREFLWREFPSPLNAVYFPHFWDNRDARSQTIDFQKMKSDWASRTPLGTLLRSRNGGGQGSNQDGSDTQNSVVLVIRGDLFRKYPNTEVMMLKGEIKNGKIKLPGNMDKAEFWSESSAVLLRPSFSARLEPDFFFIGFNLKLEEAKRPEWFFVLKERAGEVHFGLDLLQVDSDPSWQQLEDTAPNQCIQVNSPKFKAMLPNTLRSDRVASALWQKPFMMLLPTERLIPSHP